MNEKMTFVAGADDAGRRVDRVLRILFPQIPLSLIYAALRHRRIAVNGKKVEPGYKLLIDDKITIDGSIAISSSSVAMENDSSSQIKKDSDLRRLGPLILWEGKDLLFINKPRGLPSHGDNSLDLLVRTALAEQRKKSLTFSPGPLHRLDRNTSGIITFPRSAWGGRVFSELLRRRGVRKFYLALLDDLPEPKKERHGQCEVWEDRLLRDKDRRITCVDDSGKLALSRTEVMLSTGGYSLVLIELQTGITHQIRAQAASRGHPLSGDVKYGGSVLSMGYILHAWFLDFESPMPFNDIPSRIIAPLPFESKKQLIGIFGETALETAMESMSCNIGLSNSID